MIERFMNSKEKRAWKRRDLKFEYKPKVGLTREARLAKLKTRLEKAIELRTAYQEENFKVFAKVITGEIKNLRAGIRNHETKLGLRKTKAQIKLDNSKELS